MPARSARVLHDVRREAELIDHLTHSLELTPAKIKLINRAAKNIKLIAEKFNIFEKVSTANLKPDPITFSVEKFFDELKPELEILYPEIYSRLSLNIDKVESLFFDPIYFRIIILNVLENAYMHGAGEIKFKLNNEPNYLIFECENMRVLDSNEVKSKNSGLGLKIIFGIVENLGGQFESKLINSTWQLKIKIPRVESQSLS